MADLSQLLAALSAGNATIQKQDMYSPFSDVATQIGGLAVQTATPDNWKQAAMASAISGLVGGITGGMGANYQAKQQNLYSQALMNQLSGIQAQPEGISSALFADAQTAANNLKLIEQMQNKSATTNLMNQIAAQGVLSDPRMAQEVTRRVLGIEGNPVRAIATPADAATGEAGAIATNTAAMSGGQNPIYDMMDKYGMTYDDAKAEAIRLRDKAEKDQIRTEDKRVQSVNIERSMRNDFIKDPIVRDYLYAKEGLGALEKAVKDPRPIADVEITRRGIQAIEPGLAVREDDQRAITLSTSLPDWAKQIMLSSLAGESRMTPEQRQGILDIAKRAQIEKAKSYNDFRGSTLQTIEQYRDIGVDPERVLTYPAADLDKLQMEENPLVPIVKTSKGDLSATKELGMEAIRQKLALQKARQEKTMQDFGRMYGSK